MAEFKKLINPPIKASEINSESATQGQVLTANGTGGATWQDAKGTEVVANPSLSGTETDLTGLEVAGTKYKVPSGGGTEVVANPAEDATEELTKLQVGSSVYSIPSGGSGGGTQLYKHIIRLGGTRRTTILDANAFTEGLIVDEQGGVSVSIQVYSISSAAVTSMDDFSTFILSNNTVSIKLQGENVPTGIDQQGNIVFTTTMLGENEGNNAIIVSSFTISYFESDTVTPL